MLSPTSLRALEGQIARRNSLTACSADQSSSPSIPAWRREELWRSPPKAGTGTSEKGDGTFTYEFDGDGSIRLEPLVVREDHDEIGHRVWDASMMLCKMFERHASLLRSQWRGKNIIELGAGTGIASMVLARLLSQPPTTSSPDVTGAGEGRGKCTTVLVTDVAPVVKHTMEIFKENGVPGNHLDADVDAASDVERGCDVVALPKTLVWANDAHIMEAVKTLGNKLPDIVFACDMAAPVKFVPDFLATVKALMPPRPLDPEAEAEAASRDDARGRDIAWLLVSPCIIVVSQKHRDFTPPMLEGLSAIYGPSRMFELAPQAEFLHPGFISEERHSIHIIKP